jgi:hypothetical protein
VYEHSGLDDAARLDVAGYHPERAGRHRGDARRDPNKSDTSSIRHSGSSRPFPFHDLITPHHISSLTSMASYPPPPTRLGDQPSLSSSRSNTPAKPPSVPSRGDLATSEQDDDDGLDVISYWSIGTIIW